MNARMTMFGSNVSVLSAASSEFSENYRSDIENNTDPDMILFMASNAGENTSPTRPLLIEIG